MKRILPIVLMLLSLPIFASGQKESDTTGINIFTSILPQQYFVEAIGGERVNCSVLVGPGKSPATYQPKPSQMVALGKADILFTLGVPFEKVYLNKISETLPNLKVIDSSNGIEKREIEGHHHEDEHHEDEHHHEEGELDPHTWLSPVLAKIHAQNILDSLIALDGEGEEYYTERYNNLINELDEVTNDIHNKLAPLQGKILFVYHPSFGYFADEFGLVQEAIETGGKEPTPVQLDNIINEAKKEGVKIIVVQPEFSQKSAGIIAEAIDGEVVVLNPLNPDYINNLKDIAEVIYSAYK